MAAFKGVNRVLKPDGKFFIIEAHPFFRKGSEVVLETQKRFYVRDSGYKIDYKSKSDKNHWFTLDEMTKSINEAGLAILRIYEPDPSIALKEYNAAYYSMRLRYPAMIVYEICKVKP